MKKPKTLYSKESKQLTSWLKERRIESGLTIRQLAAKLGWASSIVGKIEQGERRLDVVEYVQYCSALDADANEGLMCFELLSKRGNSTSKQEKGG